MVFLILKQVPIGTVDFITINESFEADVDISLTAVSSEVQLFEGEKTDVYSYKGELIKGENI